MQTHIASIHPRSAFGGHIKGDTLFGQLCWAVRHRFGEERLESLLQGYTAGQPFLVVSDAFPSGFLPRPALPLHYYHEVQDADRKSVKKRQWIPLSKFEHNLLDWLQHAQPEVDIAQALGVDEDEQARLWSQHAQPHNTINRMTGTTGLGEFAPYAMPRIWQHPSLQLDIYVVLDESRLGQSELKDLFTDIGFSGYGRDASIGLGKFEVTGFEQCDWPAQKNANAFMTLAPCAPQGQGFDPARSWYQPFTRFGRHGDMAVHSGKPFKTPVLLADTGAVLTPAHFDPQARFTGQGLGGDGSLSNAIQSTVHQGYAPVLAIRLEEEA